MCQSNEQEEKFFDFYNRGDKRRGWHGAHAQNCTSGRPGDAPPAHDHPTQYTRLPLRHGATPSKTPCRQASSWSACHLCALALAIGAARPVLTHSAGANTAKSPFPHSVHHPAPHPQMLAAQPGPVPWVVHRPGKRPGWRLC